MNLFVFSHANFVHFSQLIKQTVRTEVVALPSVSCQLALSNHSFSSLFTIPLCCIIFRTFHNITSVLFIFLVANHLDSYFYQDFFFGFEFRALCDVTFDWRVDKLTSRKRERKNYEKQFQLFNYNFYRRKPWSN